jgi:hypothetical protein
MTMVVSRLIVAACPAVAARPARDSSLAEEVQERTVELVGVCGVDAVRAAFDEGELASRNGFVRTLAADLEGDDAIGVAVNDQCWDFDCGEVAAEVVARERGNTVERARGRGESGDVAVVDPEWLADQVNLLAGGEEALRELVDKADAVALHAGLEARDCGVVESAVGVSSDL